MNEDSSVGLSAAKDSASVQTARQSTQCTSEKADDVLSLMRKQLPVNCFLAAGFDVPEVISAMDITDNPGNSIPQIEGFIARKYNGDPRLDPINPTVDFEFPPGHRIRICNFVHDIKERCKSNTESHACNRIQ